MQAVGRRAAPASHCAPLSRAAPASPRCSPRCTAPAAFQEAQDEGKKRAQKLKAPTQEKQNLGFLAIQARERWSTSEEVHYRPGHFWLAQAPDVLEVRKIDKRCTIESVMFSAGDCFVRIGRHFDRVVTDPSGLTFEEWTPPDGSSFVINATELRAVNFTMTPTAQPQPLQEVRRTGRRAAVVSTPPQPPPKEYGTSWIRWWMMTFGAAADSAPCSMHNICACTCTGRNNSSNN